jgi:hypothetical protein
MATTDVSPDVRSGGDHYEYRIQRRYFKTFKEPRNRFQKIVKFFFGGEGVILALFAVSKCICAINKTFSNILLKVKTSFFASICQSPFDSYQILNIEGLYSLYSIPAYMD